MTGADEIQDNEARGRAADQTGHSKPPAWARERLIACVDGPMAGQWFTAGDWAERLSAAANMTAKSQPPTAIQDYVSTGQTIGHPQVPEATGTIWTSQPTTHHADPKADMHAAADDAAEDGWAW
jgi:hypothetical protein